MIDTIKINVNVKELGNIPGLIYSHTQTNKLATLPDTAYSNGQVRNMRIKVKNTEDCYAVTITGSLHKYFHGDNYVPFSFSEVKEAIYMLCEDTGLDLTQGVIQRLDFGSNVILKCKPFLYNIHLSEASRYKKDTLGNYETVRFRKSHISLTFYDKIRELDSATKKKHLTSIRKEKNVIRYEVKLFKKLATVLNLNQKHLLVDDLLKRSIQKRMVKLWYSEYKKITKAQINAYFNAFKDFKYYLKLEGILSLGGINESLVVLDAWGKTKKITRQKKYRIKAMMLSLAKQPSSRNKTIKELNKKLRIIKKDILSSI